MFSGDNGQGKTNLLEAIFVRELLHGPGELVVLLHTGERLPVSRRRREALERLLGSPT